MSSTARTVLAVCGFWAVWVPIYLLIIFRGPSDLGISNRSGKFRGAMVSGALFGSFGLLLCVVGDRFGAMAPLAVAGIFLSIGLAIRRSPERAE